MSLCNLVSNLFELIFSFHFCIFFSSVAINKMSADYTKLFSTFDEFPEPIEADLQGLFIDTDKLESCLISTQFNSGKIPTWVKGNLLRNGPGIFEVGCDKYNHWFDGLAIMQSFSIENGKV